jgi:hypothetical protein
MIYFLYWSALCVHSRWLHLVARKEEYNYQLVDWELVSAPNPRSPSSSLPSLYFLRGACPACPERKRGNRKRRALDKLDRPGRHPLGL